MKANQKPTYTANIPPRLAAANNKALKLAKIYFDEPLAWQPYLLRVMIAANSHGKYSARSIGISIPRQNGKSWVVRARCFWGALTGEKILYTCQHGDTSDEMFQELCKPFEDEEEFELQELFRPVIRKTNGQQAIKLANGGLIRFTTRTDSLARGKTFDVLIYDEAQELTTSQQAASLPAISAGKRKNPQTIYLGTPTPPGSAATVFKDLHHAVHKGESKCTWIEWAAGSIGDVEDKKRWFKVNPSLGDVLNVDAIEGECASMSADVFARERLGWWSMVEGSSMLALDAKEWQGCETDKPLNEGKLAFGIKFAWDSSICAIAWAQAVKGGASYVELYDVKAARGGTAEVAEMLYRNKDEIACVCIDGKTGAAALVQHLLDLGFNKRAIVQGSPSIVQAAATMLADEVAAHTTSHIISPALDNSATSALRRKVGKDGWGFGDSATCSAAPIEAASLALWAARTSKREPARDQEISL